jgi:hypothetical protein
MFPFRESRRRRNSIGPTRKRSRRRYHSVEPLEPRLVLAAFTYTAFQGGNPTDFANFINWLDAQGLAATAAPGQGNAVEFGPKLGPGGTYDVGFGVPTTTADVTVANGVIVEFEPLPGINPAPTYDNPGLTVEQGATALISGMTVSALQSESGRATLACSTS